MSRFSLAEALALGWKLAHNDPVGVAGTRSIRFEKQLSGKLESLVSQEGKTMGLALERVFAYEAHLARVGYYRL
jgi:hypothetical protein